MRLAGGDPSCLDCIPILPQQDGIALDAASTGCQRRRVAAEEPTAAPAQRAVQLVQLSGPALAALAAGNLTAANRAVVPLRLSPYFVASECRRVWVRRSRQVNADPNAASWVTRVIWDPERQLAVGRAGYHGPPDATGMVEVGYAVDAGHRRQGYARAALVALLDRAAREPAVGTVRATISPANTASRNLVMQYGFVEVGMQWDDEDGQEIVYEVGAGRVP